MKRIGGLRVFRMNRNVINLIICFGELLIGILLLVDPLGFTSSVLLLLGAILTIVGIAKIVTYFRLEAQLASQNGGLVTGLLLVLLGLFCIFKWEWFLMTFPVLTAIYGVITLVNGINKVQWSIDLLRFKQRYWFIAMIGAALTLIFGIIILLNPFTSTTILWTFIAVAMIVEAILDIVALIFGKF